MGKKNDLAKPVRGSADFPALKKTTATILENAHPSEPNGDGNGKALAAVATKKKATKAPPKTPKPKLTFSTDDVALRAYFIAEHRQRHGIHGDEHSDWIEAERQLKAENRKKTAKKAASSRKRA